MKIEKLKFDGKNIEEIKELTGCYAEFGEGKNIIIYTNDEVLICNIDQHVIVFNGKVSIEE